MKDLLQRLATVARRLARQLAALLIERAADRTLRELLPVVFDRLDRDLRQNLAEYPFQTDAETVIRRAIESATQTPATRDQIKTVAAMFSPIAFTKRS